MLRRGVKALPAALPALPACAVCAAARPVGATPAGRALLNRFRAPAARPAFPVVPAALAAAQQQRWMSAAKGKMTAPAMVYIKGEEMTAYCMKLIMEKWITPHVDTSAWEFYDLSCTSRDATDDKVLHDAVEAGARIGAIFKEPTITPSAEQTKSMGLKKQLPSPNGAMRRGWNGVTISRDTIHIEGLKLGYGTPPPRWPHALPGARARAPLGASVSVPHRALLAVARDPVHYLVPGRDACGAGRFPTGMRSPCCSRGMRSAASTRRATTRSAPGLSRPSSPVCSSVPSFRGRRCLPFLFDC